MSASVSRLRSLQKFCVRLGNFQFKTLYLEAEFVCLKNLKTVLTFGEMAFRAYLAFLKKYNVLKGSFPRFAHGQIWQWEGWPKLYTSYHPSPQNTYTGKLTQEMLQTVLIKIKEDR